MQHHPLQPFFDALKAGKTISCYTSDSDSGYINQSYTWIRYDSSSAKVHIEIKDVVDGGYPDIEIYQDNYNMDWAAFEVWLEPWANKIEQIKIE